MCKKTCSLCCLWLVKRCRKPKMSVCIFQKRDHAETGTTKSLRDCLGGREARRGGQLYFHSQRGCANRALTEWRGGTVHLERAYIKTYKNPNQIKPNNYKTEMQKKKLIRKRWRMLRQQLKRNIANQVKMQNASVKMWKKRRCGSSVSFLRLLEHLQSEERGETILWTDLGTESTWFSAWLDQVIGQHSQEIIIWM